MDIKRLQFHYFIGLLVIVTALTAMIFWPFIAPLALAFMAAVVVRPVYRSILKSWGGRKTLAALATVAFTLVVVLIPVGLMVNQVTVESINFYNEIQSGRMSGLDTLSQDVSGYVHALFPSWNVDVKGYVGSMADSLVHNAVNIFSGASSALLAAFVAVIGLYYMLKDGHKFRRAVVELSPLADKYDDQIIERVERAVNSVVLGSLFTAFLKGVLAWAGFVLFGVPHAVLWGMITVIVSLLPTIGAGLTIIPAAIYLIATGDIVAAIGLGVWGTVAVGLVDNFVMPIVVGKGSMVHPLVVLMAVLGGMAFFGPIGLFLGPLVAALLSALLQIYKLIVIDHESAESKAFLKD